MDDKLFQIILAVIPVLGAIVTAYLIPLIKSKTAASDLEKYKMWARIAVECAELVISGSGRGEDKKQYCIKQLTKILNSKGIKITDEQMNMLIEAAVKEMHIAEAANK